MCNSKDEPIVFDQSESNDRKILISQDNTIQRSVGQQWFRCPGEAMLSDNVIVTASGVALILCDVSLGVSGPDTGVRFVRPVKVCELPIYREG